MTRKEAFIAQRTKELRAAGKPVDVAQLEARFNELNATDAGKAQIAEKVALFNGPAKTPLAPSAPAPAAAPTPTTTPTTPSMTYDPTRQAVVPTSEARVNTGPALAPAPTPAATNSIPGFTFGAAAAAAAAPKPLTPQQAAATYGTFKEALAAMHPGAVEKYISDGTGLSADEAKALQAQFPNLYKEFANKPGGLGGALPFRPATAVPFTTGGTTPSSSTTPSGSTTGGTTPSLDTTPSGSTTPNVGSAASWASGGTTSSATDPLADYLAKMKEAEDKRQADFEAKLTAQKNALAEQARRAYEEQRLLASGEIEKINAARAGLERDYQNRRTLTMGDIANVQGSTRANLGQILRDYQAGRRAGLLGSAARGRGIDPSAAGRFLNQAAQQRGAALAQTQAGAFETISQLRKQLDEEQRRKEAGMAELARLSTTLGTKVSNYFPGIV